MSNIKRKTLKKSTKEIRNGGADSTYKRNSLSKYKSTKSPGHYLSLRIVKYIYKHIPGPWPSAKLKQGPVNNGNNTEHNNYRMVLSKQTNLKKHEKIDQTIEKTITKALSENKTQKLTKEEALRAYKQCETIQEAKDKGFPLSFLIKSRELFKMLKDDKGREIWDDAYNKGTLRKFVLNDKWLQSMGGIWLKNIKKRTKVAKLITEKQIDKNNIKNFDSLKEVKKMFNKLTSVECRKLFQTIQQYKKKQMERKINEKLKQNEMRRKLRSNKLVKKHDIDEKEGQHNEYQKSIQQQNIKQQYVRKNVDRINKDFKDIDNIQKKIQCDAVKLFHKKLEHQKKMQIKKDKELRDRLNRPVSKTKSTSSIRSLISSHSNHHNYPSNRSHNYSFESNGPNNYNYDYDYVSGPGGHATQTRGSGRSVGGDPIIDIYRSNGSANGRDLYLGANGATYVLNDGTSGKTYVTQND
eukprot:33857_1